MIKLFTYDFLHKLRWRLFQPLTLIPRNKDSSISDLFPWVINDDWETFFDLTPIIKLFPACKPLHVEKILIIVFDNNGVQISSRRYELASIQRTTLKISEFFETKISGYGTFAVFHLERPEFIKEIGSYIAERGYVSFSYRANKIRSYAHGNMDSVAQLYNGGIEYLGNASISKRAYHLQYLFGKSSGAQIILVNTYKKRLKYRVKVLNSNTRNEISAETISIPAGGIAMYSVPDDLTVSVYLVIESRAIMARPVVVDYQTQGINIFHG